MYSTRKVVAMPRFFTLLAVLVILVVAISNAGAQVTTPVPSDQDRVFQGTLIGVDADAKILTAKGGGDNTEMTFRYTDNTEIIGSESSANALAQKAGSELSVTYNVKQGNNIATRIQFQPE
jgi:hypothetical protein